jgi:hypothetical protein
MWLIIGLALMLVIGCAQAEAAAPFLSPDARVFTIAGGGTEKPRDGLPAALARISSWQMAVLPDGQVALPGTGPGLPRGGPFVVGLDGRVRMLPPIIYASKRRPLSLMAARGDGSLLAMGAGQRLIYRLPPGAPAWEPWFRMKQIEGWDGYAFDMVELPAGVALFTTEGIVRIEGGQSRRIKTEELGALGAFPDGSLVFAEPFVFDVVTVAPPLGPAREIRLRGARTLDVDAIG